MSLAKFLAVPAKMWSIKIFYQLQLAVRMPRLRWPGDIGAEYKETEKKGK
jgi:hypothetical protein